MHRISSFSLLRAGGLPLALAAGLALTASACMTPSANQSSAAGAAGEQAAKAETGSGAEGDKARGKPLTWWQRLSKYHRAPKEKPWVYGDVRPGKGLLGDDEDGLTLYRQGEGQSSDPSKPTKVRR